MATKSLPFNLPFTQAAKYFARKVPMTREQFDTLASWAKTRAFTVANVAKAEILQDIMNAQQRAIEEGLTLADFNASLDAVMDVRGWTGTTPWHAETITRTGNQMAYGTGRLEQQREQSDDFPYWLFVATLDDRTTDECATLNGTVFPIDDSEWYPPIQWNCRSSGEPLTEDEAQEYGIDPERTLPDLPDFEGPGRGGDEYQPDLSNLDDALAKIVRDELAGFDPANVED